MKKGYWVVAYRSISDESAVKAYAALAVPAVQSFGGRFLTGSTSQVQAHEAGLQQRLTKRRFRHSAPARNATTASLKVCRSRRNRALAANFRF